MSERRETWSGHTGFILAAIGSAVGLGSIWKFPYEVGSNGGAAFVLFYLGGLVLAVIPLMLAEMAIGRRGRGDPMSSIAAVALACGASRAWAYIGLLGVLTGALILSFYSVIGGWTLAYVFDIAMHGLSGTDPRIVQGRYDALLASPLRMTGYHALFMALSVAIVVRGVGGGIEATCKVLMPVLFALIVGLAAYSAATGDLASTLRFLFAFDPQRISARAAIDALGLGFFSIGVALGLMITYAAYAEADIDLTQVAVVAVSADTAISLLAGFAVFPIVFANGLDPASGPGLVFVTLPLAFAGMPFGAWAAAAFFVLLFVAALASAISMLELAVALLTHRHGWSRPWASAAAGCTCFVAGLATVLSFNVWDGWHPLAGVAGLERATAFDLIDGLTSNLLLPAIGMALALFAGWCVPAALIGKELRLRPVAATWLRWMLRYVVPGSIAVAALASLWH